MSSAHIPYGKHNITEEDIESVTRILRGDYLTQGPEVDRFEQALASRLRVQHVVAVNSATSALHIACLSLGLGAGDWLWTSPISFVASGNCGLYCGASVDFVDIDENTGLLCPMRLKEKLENAKKRGCLPKVVVPVHLAGSSCDMESIRVLADEYSFSIVEDASHAIGGTYKGMPVGSCRYSEITVSSLHPVKIITSGEGGVATTNSERLYNEMKRLRSHGITKERGEFIEKGQGPWHYEQHSLGFNYRMSDIHAALGRSQLERLDMIVEERQRLLATYQDRLSGLDCRLLEIPNDVTSSVHLAVILLGQKARRKHRVIFEKMREANIGVQLHYEPIHLQPYYVRRGFKQGMFANAEEYSRRAISLPLFPGLDAESQEYVVKELERLIATA